MVHSLVPLLLGVASLCVLLPPPLVTAEGNLNLCESETAPIIYNKKHEKTFNAEHGLVTKEDVQLSFEGKKIKCIQAISLWLDGTGGTASLKVGGLGQSSATIFLQGQFLRGYSFRVTVRGEPSGSEPTTTSTLAPSTPVSVNARMPDSQSCFCRDYCGGNIFDERIFVPSFNID